jgi:hypothetical protein
VSGSSGMLLIAMNKSGSGRPVVDVVISIFHYCCGLWIREMNDQFHNNFFFL